ncbi:MAG: formate/nitrite transporter family protein [Actinomycetota bacterium]
MSTTADEPATASASTSSARTSSARSDHENELLESFDQSVEEGAKRLNRSIGNLFATGLMAGLDVGFGVLALLFVQDQTDSEILGGLAFTIGFFALHLGRSELFTENFLVPVTTVITGRGSFKQLMRLWWGTYVTNLIGGYIVALLLVSAYPDLHGTAVELGTKITDRGISAESFGLAVLAGGAITLMTWMIRNAATEGAKLVAVGTFGFLLGATHMNHVVVISIKMFAGLQVGGTSYGYLDWLALSSWSVLGNMIGGLGLVTVLRLVQIGPTHIQRRRRTQEFLDRLPWT